MAYSNFYKYFIWVDSLVFWILPSTLPLSSFFSSIFISEILFFIWCDLKINVWWDDFLISPQLQNSVGWNKCLFSQDIGVRKSRETWLGALVQQWLQKIHWWSLQLSQVWLRSHCSYSLKRLSAGPPSTSKCKHMAGGFLHIKQPKVS